MSTAADPIALTKELLRIDTSTGSITTEKSARIVSLIEKLGFCMTVVRVGELDHIRADIGRPDSRLNLAFVGHYDVVPAGSGWVHPPFDAVEENGTIYSRGASDMKSGDAAMLCAAIELSSHGIATSIFLPADEETASAGMPALLDRTATTFDFCICGEPTSKVTLGDCIKVGRRGVVQGTITLLGRSGHAAYADRTPNVIDGIPAVLEALGAPWDDGCYGTRTTVSVTNLTTDSTATNVIPSRVDLTFDARFSPIRRCKEIVAALTDRLSSSGIAHTLNVKKQSEPYLTDGRTDQSSPQALLVSRAVACIERVCGITPSITCDGGTSDARFASWRGIPTIEFGVPHGNMHGPDEFVKTDDIRSLTRLYVELGLSLANTRR